MEKNNRTENLIRVNQNAYSVKLPKYIAVLEEKPVILCDRNENPIKEYACPKLAFDEASGDNVAVIDLGDIPVGAYVIKCGDSRADICVSESAFTELTKSLIKALYYQRCGCELKPGHAGIFTHKACHTAPAADWADKTKKKSVIGGWHDAGDYGKYVSPGAVTVAHMLYAYLLFAKGCSDDINIPETGNNVPDILNEARYELDWILKMQREDGAFYHKLTKDHFAPFIMPEDDTDPEYLIPPTHCATADAVAVLALASRIYDEFDHAFSEKALSSAVSGWKWLVSNQNFSPYMNPEGVRTGPYGDSRVIDELFWAACELFAATGDNAYAAEAEKLYIYARDAGCDTGSGTNSDAGCDTGSGANSDAGATQNTIFKEMLEKQEIAAEEIKKKFPHWHTSKLSGLNTTEFGWSDVSGLGALCCLFSLKEKGGSVLYDELMEDFLKRSEKALERVNASIYRTALKTDEYHWGSILVVMNNAMSMIVNYLLTGREDMKNGALSQLDYSLGLNALDISFITGFGVRSVQNPHHRPSGADGIDAPVPGFIVGGPNKQWTYPETKERLGDTPAAKYYLDETPSADTNEVAIYWNSPVIFVAAFFAAL
ncbi:MAG: glycoside hydrolase family 9 protein [Lachnospiraceae bacterium]|nr:glycoside hydrolase family 9 protein [Lachnospiraceae bacterium]